MATGDDADLARRERTVLPGGWFPPVLADTPVLAAVLAMPAAVFRWAYDFLGYVRAQTRIATATGGFLDLAALDFFGTRLRRRAGQSDAALRTRILAEVLRRRVTRTALQRLLMDLTGREPVIVEPARPADTGVWGGPRLGYGVAGRYGSLSRPGEVFVDVSRDLTTGAPRMAGWGVPRGGYGVGAVAWLGREQAADFITDDDILAAIVATAPAGGVVWTRITN